MDRKKKTTLLPRKLEQFGDILSSANRHLEQEEVLGQETGYLYTWEPGQPLCASIAQSKTGRMSEKLAWPLAQG